MKVTVIKETDVNIDLTTMRKILNGICKNIRFNIIEKEFSLHDTVLNENTSINEFREKTSPLTEGSDKVILISNKQYDDNFFFHSKENKYYLLSLFDTEDLTDHTRNTVAFYFITDILALHLDNSFRHIDDGEKDCIYNFRMQKEEIHDGVNSATMCDKCQERILNLEDDKKELLLNDVIDLLDELKKSNSYNDIIEYWQANQKEQVKIFFSYAHKDRAYLDEFKEYIKIFERNGLVERWDDNELIVGEKWDNTIKDKIYSADIIIFLLSSTSLASDYIYNNELKIAFELNEMDEAYVIPIIIKDCLWNMTEFKEFQILPIDGKAVNSWERKEEAWTSIARGLKKAIDNIISAKQNSLEKLQSSDEKSSSTKVGKVIESVKLSESNEDMVLKFLQVYSRWWFNISRIINWGSERDGFKNLKNISESELREILSDLEKNKMIVSKASSKNKNKFLYKIK